MNDGQHVQCIELRGVFERDFFEQGFRFAQFAGLKGRERTL